MNPHLELVVTRLIVSLIILHALASFVIHVAQ